ncbi:LLM class F420-dependent oxidoreductase [Umezawaea endophytica]|uniref:LLM class F420-dependent oxidoreductase n=1 Tax=Umezawaea endophytica TaxID=1654476 RepID=A0A9X2VQL8_9PSEU|nr:LLM class F420-dependent oxidoreductase [Umezawaea endophytica]MCS7481056.1 LLM class F420-dependent oxidoreductase [Umezawaea endophytica]
MSTGVVLPYWLDRPDGEAVEIAVEADRLGFGTVWVGEMATFDAFALATAIGLRTKDIRLRVGPLAAGVRGPVALALGVSSVVALTGRQVDLALGASSPAIVAGWHDRPWAGAAPRMREAVRAVRSLLGGERLSVDGAHVRSHGFRLREPVPGAEVSVAAFGPAMLRVAAEEADEVVLNLVTPEQVARVREVVDGHAAKAGRAAPRLAVWVTAAVDPGPNALRQVSEQLALYLRAPGYAEMFTELGHGTLVAQAKAGVPRRELAVPRALLDAVCALGSAAAVRERIAEYHRAGADHVGVAPSTADDPAGRRVLAAVG